MGKRDRYILSVILGGAIGSVLGLMMAPDKGDQTRKKVGSGAQHLLTQGKNLKEHIAREHGKEIEEAVELVKKGSTGLWEKLRELISRHR